MKNNYSITGTDIWYYFICKREAWLMLHKIVPDEEDENIEIGRFISEFRYGREKKEIDMEYMKFDHIKSVDGKLIIREVKKSSKFIESAKYQLLYYLDNLKKMGIEAEGELVFPEERRKEKVNWNQKDKEILDKAVEGIKKLSEAPVPPKAKKIKFCGKCAYREFCWA